MMVGPPFEVFSNGGFLLMAIEGSVRGIADHGKHFVMNRQLKRRVLWVKKQSVFAG